MSVEPRPPWITSAPWAAAPRPSASASGAELVRISCSVISVSAPVSRTKAAPTASATPSSSSAGTTPLMSYALKIFSRSLTSAPFSGFSCRHKPAGLPRRLPPGKNPQACQVQPIGREPVASLGVRLGRGGGAQDAQMAAAAHLDALADGFGGGLALGVPRLGGTRRLAGVPGAAGLADDVRQRLNVLGPFPGGILRQPYPVPPARHDEPGGVLLAQVVTVRLDVCRERPEHGRRVAVHVRERVDGRLLARGT